MYCRKPNSGAKVTPFSISLCDIKNLNCPRESIKKPKPIYKSLGRISMKYLQATSKLTYSPIEVYSFCRQKNNAKSPQDNTKSRRKLTVQNFEDTIRHFSHVPINVKPEKETADKSVQQKIKTSSKINQSNLFMVADQSCGTVNITKKFVHTATNTKVTKPLKFRNSLTQTNRKSTLNLTGDSLFDMFGDYQKYLLTKLEQASAENEKPISMVELLMVLNEVIFDFRRATYTYMTHSSEDINDSETQVSFDKALQEIESIYQEIPHLVLSRDRIDVIDDLLSKGSEDNLLVTADNDVPLMVSKHTTMSVDDLSNDLSNELYFWNEIPCKDSSVMKHSSQCCCIDCITK